MHMAPSIQRIRSPGHTSLTPRDSLCEVPGRLSDWRRRHGIVGVVRMQPSRQQKSATGYRHDGGQWESFVVAKTEVHETEYHRTKPRTQAIGRTVLFGTGTGITQDCKSA